jgi:hypothetical protein
MIVIGVFVVSMIAIVLYTIFDPKTGAGERLVVDDSQIMVHNNADKHFTRAPVELFEVSRDSD